MSRSQRAREEGSSPDSTTHYGSNPLEQLKIAREIPPTQRKFRFETFLKLAEDSRPADVAIDRVLAFNNQYEDARVWAFKGRSRVRGVVLAVVRIFAPPGYKEILEKWRSVLENHAQVVVRLEWDKVSPATRRQLTRIADRDGIVRSQAKVEKLIAGIYGSAARVPERAQVHGPNRAHLLDLTRLPFITIDPPGTPDPEDAIYARVTRNGSTQLYISFPDATWRVKPGSAPYKRARKSAFTLYGARRALPILGDRLGTDELVFKEGCERQAFTLMVEIDKQGKLTKRKLLRSLIKSHAALTYDEFGEIQRGKSHRLSKLVRLLSEVTYRISQSEKGALRPAELPVGREYRHVVQTCMTLAYRVIAEMLRARGIPALYRVRQTSEPAAITKLVEKIRAVGIEAHVSDFEEGVRVAALLMCLQDSQNLELYSRTLDLLQGRSHYTDEPISSAGAEGRLKIEIKSRSLAGLANQWQLAHMCSGERMLPETELHEMRKILNRKELTLRAVSAQVSLFDYISDRLGRSGELMQVKVKKIVENEAYVTSVDGFISGVLPLDFAGKPLSFRKGYTITLKFEGYDPKGNNLIFGLP